MLLVNNGLHIEILIDPDSPVGSTDAAGIKDVVLESAITTIMDFEDSVAAVDADDKVLGYRNWLGLNRGDLDRGSQQGRQDASPACSMRTAPTPPRRRRAHAARAQPAVRAQRRPPDDQRRDRLTTTATTVPRGPEGIQDALFTSLIAMHGLKDGRTTGPTVR